jgi:hypothetical protein
MSSIEFLPHSTPTQKNKLPVSNKLNDYFEASIEIPRIKVGDRQTIETLINEEALLFAGYLRKELVTWTPRIACAR